MAGRSGKSKRRRPIEPTLTPYVHPRMAQIYEGEWADDAMHGRGSFRYASGAKFEVRRRGLRES